LGWENDAGESLDYLESGRNYRLVLHYRCPTGLPPSAPVSVSFALLDTNGHVLINHRNDFTAELFEAIPPTGEFVCRVPKLPLAHGEYLLNLYVGTGRGPCDSLVDAARVVVQPGDFFGTGHLGDPSFCRTFVEASWDLRGGSDPPLAGKE
jgi:lipopolysaccharide transport system ATP-binding protein